jgi:hypothetical protein
VSAIDASTLHDELRSVLERSVHADGGVGWGEAERAEAEPTALAALALGDERCAEWLAAHQDDDGGYAFDGGTFETAAVTALAALALPEGAARERALDRMVTDRAAHLESLGDYPLAWGWTTTTYSWVEPTSRVLHALRLLRPGATDAIDEAVASLAEREVDGGGWNYGNADVRGTDLKPYAQTTAVAVIGLHGMGDLASRGAAALRTLAVQEPGGLSLAQSLVACRLVGDDEAVAQLLPLLADAWQRSRFLGNLGALAWSVLATGDAVDALQVSP